ncbi:hypothetical protein [Paenibacillus gorillae]|uniref:hypothetical protein n=1 Tax=Paenibacillus gorillae TaxID=1243662 RepID=UPI0004AE4D22|nr:hypothetical protein [Paenibacillus gorillae]
MPTQHIDVVQTVGTLEQAFNSLAKLQKTMRYLVNGQLDFENIRARSIKAENIEVGSLTAEEIKAGTITADKMDVDELSAITANLGHIMAGLIESVEIFGSYISTANGTFPRAEMSNTSNLFGAYSSDGDGVEVISQYTNDKPAVFLIEGGQGVGVINSSSGHMNVRGPFGNLNLTALLDVKISGDGTRGVIFESWSRIYSAGNNQSLQTALNALSTRISDLEDRVDALEGP